MKKPRIVADPEILSGEPVFGGTRAPVKALTETIWAAAIQSMSSLKIFSR